MSELDTIQDWLSARLPELLKEYRIPGGAAAVLSGDEVVEAAAGVLSMATGVEATPDSVFQVGSITKVWTTTLGMQLVDDGLLDLDAPVRRYLPAFRIADDDAAARITVRQLMCHTAGFEGDIFTDTGRGDDAVEKYLGVITDTPQLFPPGERFSYNNAGYCVLGRIVEVLRGKPYDACLRDHLIQPLGLAHAASGADEAIMHRAAVGHLTPTPDSEPTPAPFWSLVRSNAPAGSQLAMSPRDLLGFVRLHLRKGLAADGSRLLSESSVTDMQRRQVELPYLGLLGDAWGLGWELFDWPGATVIGHDGGTVGQSAFLRVVPEAGVAVALLTNGGEGMSAYFEIFRHILKELAGVQLPEFPSPVDDGDRADFSRFVGTYASSMGISEVSVDDDGLLWIEKTPTGPLAELLGGPERHRLVRSRADTFVTVELTHGIHAPHAFVGSDGEGRAAFLHTGRADRRVTA